MKDEPAHFATEGPVEFKIGDDGKIKVVKKMEDDYGRPLPDNLKKRLEDGIIRIVIIRVKNGVRQIFKNDKWIDLGECERISKKGPTLAIPQEDVGELIEDLMKIFKMHSL